MSETSNAVAPSARKENFGWAFYFAFLLLASVGVAGFMIWFNHRLQLTEKTLHEARELWKEKGPKNYNMIYTKKLGNAERGDLFAVKVRGGKVTEVLMNDRPLAWNRDDGQAQDPRIFHSMDNLLRDMERFLDLDQKSGAPKVYCVANFDERNGAVLRYVRRVMGSTDRVELEIKLTPIAD